MPVRSRVVAALGIATVLTATLWIGIIPSALVPAGAAILTGASMPVQEFVNDGAGGRLWNDYNQTADSQGPNITGRPSAITYGLSVHVESRSTNGDLVEFDNDGANHRLWNSYDLTQAAGGPTIGADPAVVLYQGTAVHIFAEAANGDLVEYTNDGAGGRLWNAYDLTELTSGPCHRRRPQSGHQRLLGRRLRPGDVAATWSSSRTRPPGTGRWSVSDLTQSSGGPQLNGDPAAVVSGTSFHVYAQGPGGDLYEFASASGGQWGSSDLTAGDRRSAGHRPAEPRRGRECHRRPRPRHER